MSTILRALKISKRLFRKCKKQMHILEFHEEKEYKESISLEEILYYERDFQDKKEYYEALYMFTKEYYNKKHIQNKDHVKFLLNEMRIAILKINSINRCIQKEKNILIEALRQEDETAPS